MPDHLPGELLALAPLADTDGTWRLGAIIATPAGAVVGVLAAPANGAAGALRFEPVPRLAEGLPNLQDQTAAATVAVGAVAAVDPNDPRGIRGGTRRRPPGMVG